MAMLLEMPGRDGTAENHPHPRGYTLAIPSTTTAA